MMTLEEARRLQRKSQRRSVLWFFGTLLGIAAICVAVCMTNARAMYVAVPLSLGAMMHVNFRTQFTEIFRKKEYSGTVTYFHVRTEMVKKNFAAGAGQTYNTYTVYRADMAIEDSEGKTRYKTFAYTKEYDDVWKGDKATVLRFVDKPIIEFKEEKQ